MTKFVVYFKRFKKMIADSRKTMFRTITEIKFMLLIIFIRAFNLFFRIQVQLDY